MLIMLIYWVIIYEVLSKSSRNMNFGIKWLRVHPNTSRCLPPLTILESVWQAASSWVLGLIVGERISIVVFPWLCGFAMADLRERWSFRDVSGTFPVRFLTRVTINLTAVHSDFLQSVRTNTVVCQIRPQPLPFKCLPVQILLTITVIP
jgi:hypothetical protein